MEHVISSKTTTIPAPSSLFFFFGGGGGGGERERKIRLLLIARLTVDGLSVSLLQAMREGHEEEVLAACKHGNLSTIFLFFL